VAVVPVGVCHNKQRATRGLHAGETSHEADPAGVCHNKQRATRGLHAGRVPLVRCETHGNYYFIIISFFYLRRILLFFYPN